MDNIETMGTQDTRTNKKEQKTTQYNMCWTPLYLSKHK